MRDIERHMDRVLEDYPTYTPMSLPSLEAFISAAPDPVTPAVASAVQLGGQDATVMDISAHHDTTMEA